MERFEALRERYRASFPDKARDLRRAWTAVCAGDETALTELQHLVHRLAGSAPIYGYDEGIGRPARAADAAVCAWREVAAGSRPPLAALCVQIGETLAALLHGLET